MRKKTCYDVSSGGAVIGCCVGLGFGIWAAAQVMHPIDQSLKHDPEVDPSAQWLIKACAFIGVSCGVSGLAACLGWFACAMACAPCTSCQEDDLDEGANSALLRLPVHHISHQVSKNI